MLCITREREEDTIITTPEGRTIIVKILDIRGNQKVRVGFTADPAVVIHRREVHEAIQREQEIKERIKRRLEAKTQGGPDGTTTPPTQEPVAKNAAGSLSRP